MKRYRKKLLVALFMGLLFNSIAQNDVDLTQDLKFFKEKEGEFKSWIKRNEINKYVSYDNLSVTKDQVALSLKVSGWEELNKKVEQKRKTRLERWFFDKMLFTFDLKPEEAVLKIDIGSETIFVEYKEADVVFEREKKMGDMRGSASVMMDDLNVETAEIYRVRESAKRAKELLEKGLKEYFSVYEASFENYIFEPYPLGDGQFVIDIKNVRDVILDKGYFEFIRMTYTFGSDDDFLTISYNLDCKYGSGIIWAPRSSGYYDMSEKYEKEMRHFSNKLSGQISEILTN